MAEMGNTIKVSLAGSVLYHGHRHETGETIDVPQAVADHLCAVGLAVLVSPRVEPKQEPKSAEPQAHRARSQAVDTVPAKGSASGQHKGGGKSAP